MVRIEPDPERLRALGMSLGELQPALQTAEAQLPAGALVDHDRRTVLEATGFVLEAAELNRLVVAVKNGRPIYLGDVATRDRRPRTRSRRWCCTATAAGFEPAVTVTLSKRMGANATALADAVLAKVEALRGSLLPRDLQLTVTRNYGETAGDKSNELIEHLLIATLSVIALILLAMGWRSRGGGGGGGAGHPGPDPVHHLPVRLHPEPGHPVRADLLHRHPGGRRHRGGGEHPPAHAPARAAQAASPQVVVEAVDEVGNPTILATFAVIAAILPMAFVRGLMGPYMRPDPGGRQRGHAVQPGHRLRHQPLGRAQGLQVGGAPAGDGRHRPAPRHREAAAPETEDLDEPESRPIPVHRRLPQGHHAP